VTFQGWTPLALAFYEGLEADNSKAYWTAHKAAYTAEVYGPMDELLHELEAEFGLGRIYRPLRDVRFSADKTPYKTATCATLPTGGYVVFSKEGLAVGSGYQSMAPDQLDRYRNAVATDQSGNELCEVIAQITAQGIEISVEQQLKEGPRAYSKEHPRADFLRYKDISAWKRWPVADWLATPRAKDHITEALRATYPLHLWLEANVGPTNKPRHYGRREVG